jgi:hypothetical protein
MNDMTADFPCPKILAQAHSDNDIAKFAVALNFIAFLSSPTKIRLFTGRIE